MLGRRLGFALCPHGVSHSSGNVRVASCEENTLAPRGHVVFSEMSPRSLSRAGALSPWLASLLTEPPWSAVSLPAVRVLGGASRSCHFIAMQMSPLASCRIATLSAHVAVD